MTHRLRQLVLTTLTASGTIDLKGLDVKIARAYTTALMTALGWTFGHAEEELKQGGIANKFIEAAAKELGVHPFNAKLRDLRDQPTLSNPNADVFFAKVGIRPTMGIDDGPGAMHPGPKAYNVPPEITIGVISILGNLLRHFGWMLTEERLYEEILGAVNHELLHAADWCYQVIAGGKGWRDVNPHLDAEGSEDYYNRDTELKSFASTVALTVWRVLVETMGLNPREIFKMESKDFWTAMQSNSNARKTVLDNVRPENRKVFLQRVVKLLKDRAKEEIRVDEKFEKHMNPPEPNAYQFGKYRE